ncbi:hypothetical protein GJ700_29230 [Duganella sp. FT92W]|uniref:Calcineurin-like phosphoesterase domain-containing protein n=1 Tax=Pseudoduganella rivuli TaxID=2666085 RepID=A0A7X2IUN1_9BURK|nr:metallophosphoesterase [Pseudoduganella rivuli]MRV75803.1 hypothetical protein [Pseudoduganella rivuli]
MLAKTRIAVISDLHIGDDPIALDLSPHDLPEEKKVGLPKSFLETFEKYVSSDSFKMAGSIDMLCITGDISHKANPNEFRHANDVVSKLAVALNIPEEQVYYVPGNHDVHWPVMQLQPQTFWQQYRYKPLLQPDLIFQRRHNEKKIGAFDTDPHFVVWHSEKRLIVGINSAAFDAPEPEHGKHHGIVHQETLDSLENYLNSISIASDELRICLLHHHPINYSDVNPNYPDFSLATNAGNLFELLSRNRFDLIIHGHRHIPQLLHRATTTNGHPITILGAGSLSAKLNSEWYGVAQNQFHVIEVAGRNDETSIAYGNVATWNFAGGVWKESHHQLGLCATEGFGSRSTPIELQQSIENQLTSYFSSTAFCRWNLLEEAIPALRYASTKVAYEALCKAAEAIGVEVVAGMDTKKQNWMIVKSSDGI